MREDIGDAYVRLNQ